MFHHDKLERSLKEVDKKSGGKTEEVALGDIIWVKSRRLSWWPAQVADPSAVSKSKKPRKNSSSQVLVRIYGSYIYKYVDPVICRSEFKKILDKNNGSYSSIFEKYLERDIGRSQSGSRKRKVSSSKDKKTQTTEAAPPKKIKPNDFSPSNGNSLAEKSKDFSARRIKIMRSLGLIAPLGSPFNKDMGHS